MPAADDFAGQPARQLLPLAAAVSGRAPVMLTLPLLAPRISEALAAEWLDRGAAAALAQQAEMQRAWPRGVSSTGDVLAWVLAAFFLLTLGVIAGCILALRTKPRALAPEQALIEEVQRDEEALARSDPDKADGGESWERPADWWQRGE